MYKIDCNDLKILKITDRYILKKKKAWIDQGSLLGLTRDGRFIDWDDDIDITCLYEEKPELTIADIKSLLKHDYIVLTSRYDYTIKKLNSSSDHKKMDLTFIYEKNGTFYKSYSDYKHQNLIAKVFEKMISETLQVMRRLKKPRQRLITWFLLNTITHVYRSYVMRTVDMICPKWQFRLKMEPLHKGFQSIFIYSHPERYLEYKFGNDWKIPKREWDYTTEDGGLKMEKVQH